MILRAALSALLLLWASALNAQESVVTGLSTDNIALNATFKGSELLVFGAIRRTAPVPSELGPLDVIIAIKGPDEPVMVRRKARWFGIWVNESSVEVRRTPSFYAIASTRPIGEILSREERLFYRIGMDRVVRQVQETESVADSQPFTRALVRLREDNGLYAELDDAVMLTEETLFQTELTLPSNIVEGIYTADFFLVRNRTVVSSRSAAIIVEKTGVERWLYNLAQDRPLLYGLFSVALALAAGWLAASGFRLAKR